MKNAIGKIPFGIGKTADKIKIVLVISSLMPVLYIFNTNVFGRGYVAPPRPDTSFLNSSKWPQGLQNFLRMEILYGDRKIDQLEAKYLVNAAFQSQSKTDSNSVANNIQPIAILITVLMADANTIEACISQIRTKTNYSYEESKKILQEKIDENRSSINSYKSLCEEIVSKSGNVAVRAENTSDWLFYQILQTKGITPAIYSNFVVDNKLDITHALESLKFIKEPDEYVFSLTDFIFKESSRLEEESRLAKLNLPKSWAFMANSTEAKIKLAELSEYMSSSNGNKLADMLMGTLPRDEYGFRMIGGGPEDSISRAVTDSRMHFLFLSKYLNAKDSSTLLDVFAIMTPTTSNEVRADKAWLLYRYHPELIQPLTKIYTSGNFPSGSNKTEIRLILSGLLRYGEIFKEYTPYLPDKNILN
jgi:hypothetical protein